ncbi:protein of unknown function [Clostridium cavendishii DSM 21758]|uniref:ATP-grasp domain-containing protein n=1 Tax=Clostridium cavendishii DSM 21758 TaxID=1121302 RepID=A0A1M6RTV5_9CLOT|nr:ATP-grasp domain-containing protein [Clostridium cavendishii]SHK35885.1 protein of unknown function [Clostridium cavendishii DSM 21758]
MKDNFVLKVEEVFDIKGRGTVIAGKYKGIVKVGDILITLTGEKVKVLGIEMLRIIEGNYDERIGLLVEWKEFKKEVFKDKLLFRSYNTTFLFCSDPLNKNKPDMDYIDEYEEAKSNGINVLLFSYEDLTEFGKVNVSLNPQINRVIYRGWMLKPKEYECLYNNLEDKNYYLINTPDEYVNTHYLPNWYQHFEVLTPKTIWSENVPNKEEIINMLKDFNEEPIIVKDYVKSRKHEWYESCYIENPKETEKALKVVNNFIKGQGEYLNQGVVLRKFIELESIGFHGKSGMPISNELRLFIFNYKVVCVVGYWNGKNINEYPEFVDDIIEKIKNIKSNFFTVDIAKKSNGEWIVMELGDGQVSGLQEYDVKTFYLSLIKSLE